MPVSPLPPLGGEVAEDPFPASAALSAEVLAFELPPIEPIAAAPLHLGGSLVGLAMCGFGAVAAASLLGYSPSRLSDYLLLKGRPDRQQRLDEIAGRDTEYLCVAFVYGAAGASLGVYGLLHATSQASWPWTLALFLVAMVFVAGTLPAAAAQAKPERALLASLPPLRAMWYLLRWPLVLPLLQLTRLCLRLFGWQRSAAADTAEVQKQVMAAVADTVAETTAPEQQLDATLVDAQRTWIGNIIALKDLQVAAIMTPRPDVIALPAALPLRKAVQQALEQGFSRYPVYRERIDEVVGVFHVKDALSRLAGDQKALEQTSLQALLRQPLFVPVTTGVAQLLKRFQSGNQHLAVVVDEHGTTVGLVTVEDVLEQIVGDLGDEYDTPTTAPEADQIRVVTSGRVLEIPARTGVGEVNRLLGSELPEEGDWETVAGLVIARANRIPAIDESIVIDGVEFKILQADERRVRRLRATLLDAEPAQARS
jgi:CBS domain containing-hemolysin-like protein